MAERNATVPSTERNPLMGLTLAAVGLIVTLAAAFLALSQIDWGPALICALVAALILEGLSVSITAAAYFSLAGPLFFLIMFGGSVISPAWGGLLSVLLGVSVAGLCGLVRFLVALPDRPQHSIHSRLAGYGLNVIRVALVGGAMFGTVKAGLGVLVAAGVGYAVWLFLDCSLAGAIVSRVEELETADIWQETPLGGKAIFALVPVAGIGGVGLFQAEVQTSVLAVLSVAFFGLIFRSTARYYIDELLVQDQKDLQISLKRVKYRERQLKEQLTTCTADNKLYVEELRSVYTMAKSLGASTKVEDVVGVVSIMIKILRIPYQSRVVFLYKQGVLVPVQGETPFTKNLDVFSLLQLEEPTIKEVLTTREAGMDTDLAIVPESRIFKDERSVICVPLMVSKEIVGVIYVGESQAKAHNEQHLKHLKMIAALAAPSLKTALLFEEKDHSLRNEQSIRAGVEAKNSQLAELQWMGQRMGATMKTLTTTQVVAESIRKMIPSAQSVIFFTPGDELSEGHALKAEFADTPYEGYVKNLELRDDEGVLGKAVELGKTLLVSNTSQSGLRSFLGAEKSLVVAPLMIRLKQALTTDSESAGERELLGCLYVGAAQGGAFTEEHRNLIETVSYQAAMALKNARLYEQTQQQALTDGLTGLFTHRLFQERLVEEIAAARKSNDEIVLVMVDCDNFKTFNDTLGHPAGDALLKDVAALLKDKVRACDIVCRYGGDEFALLLKNTNKPDAIRMCERIREAFQLRFGGNEIQVTASIGLACFPTDALSKKDLAKAADDALYVAKRGGRNKVAPSKTLAERMLKPLVQEVLLRPTART